MNEPFARDASGKPAIALDPASLYTFGMLVRGAETLLLDLFGKGLLSGTTHTCLGQELCQMSVVRALDDPNDAVLSNHRNHGHFLTYSGAFHGLIAEIMGRNEGICNGVGGSQHLAYRHFHSNGVQAGMTGIGVGQALARKLRGETGIVVTIVGDGTLGEGLLYESLNLASIWELPLLFVVENNGIAQTTPTSKTIGGSIEARGAAFGLTTYHLDDADPEFFKSVENVVAEVRSTRKPGFLVIDTMRMGPHSKGDDLRDASEMEAIRKRDPLAALGRRLPDSVRQGLDEQTAGYLREVLEWAESLKDGKRLQRPETIFRSNPKPVEEVSPDACAVNVRAAINASLRRLLSEDPHVIVLGEDLHEPYGGAFKVTAGLSSEFPERVISTPISEAGLMGAGIGLALAGFKPVVEVMFADFLTLGMDQLFNHAVKFPGMFPDAAVPLVIRTPSGGRRGYGPTHSQSPENLMCGVPGLTVVYPSHRHEAGALLRRAVSNWPYPTVFFEHKLLYGLTCERAGYRECEPDPEDFGAALFPTLSQGGGNPDITIVCYGHIVSVAEKAAEILREEELNVEIVVPSLLSPFPKRTLAALLIDSPCVITLEESHSEFGFGAELGSVLLEEGYRGRYRRLGTPPVPIPASRMLEASVIPDHDALIGCVVEMLSAPVL